MSQANIFLIDPAQAPPKSAGLFLFDDMVL